ncbi:hypothetical protein LTR53_002750 [Teratosphaeriaceae sp. CCFEE 6253]|nr:hypothetical protein LTR53_002750 [Teratosphaeriaceae sp. CCFEE 6253]
MVKFRKYKTMSGTPVLIIGGGIGGLALAHGLKQHRIPFHVYERDRTESYRAQGYRIRIGGPAIDGLEYLLDAETMSDFNLSCADIGLAPIPEFDAETARLVEPDADTPASPGAEMTREISALVAARGRTVDRGAMREVLIKHLSPGSISYDRKFLHYEETEQGVIAHFEDGTSAVGALLVGADGRGSMVRPQLLPDLHVLPTGSYCIYGKTYLSPEVLEALAEVAGQRMSFVKDRSPEQILAMGLKPIRFSSAKDRKARGLSCPQDYLFWGLRAAARPLGLDLEASLERLSLEELEQRALEVSRHWHPSLRVIVEHEARDETSAFAIDIVAKGFAQQAWEPNAHVTLIGDAVHPVAGTGSGAVMAIMDAASLCRGVTRAERETGFEPVIAEYEKAMRLVAGDAIPASWRMMDAMSGMTRSNETHIGEMAMRMRARNIAKMR